MINLKSGLFPENDSPHPEAKKDISSNTIKWQKYTQDIVDDLSLMIKSRGTNQVNLKSLYQHAAIWRQKVKLEMEPHDVDAQYFGALHTKGSDLYTWELFSRSVGPWKTQSIIILFWLRLLISSKDNHFYEIREIAPTLSDFIKVARYSIQADKPFKVIECNYADKQRKLLMLTFYYYFFEDNLNNFAIMYYCPASFSDNLDKGFERANALFLELLKPPVSISAFLTNAGEFMHFMAMFLPAMRGNASIVEVLVLTAAKFNQLQINDLNYASHFELRWDLRAFITPDPIAYSNWFVQRFMKKTTQVISPMTAYKSSLWQQKMASLKALNDDLLPENTLKFKI